MSIERIRVVSGDVTLKGVRRPIRELGFQGSISPGRALLYGQHVVVSLSYALNSKLGRAQLDPEIVYDQGSLIRERLEQPKISWGVVGVDLAAGTLAAMHAIRDKAAELEYDSILASTVEGQDQSGFELAENFDRVWFSMAITNPELQPRNRLAHDGSFTQ